METQLREASKLLPTPTSFLACKSKHVNLSIHQVLMYLHSRMKLCEVDDSAHVDADRQQQFEIHKSQHKRFSPLGMPTLMSLVRFAN